MSDPITTGFVGDSYQRTTVQQAPDFTGGYPVANAASYEQYADLVSAIVASGNTVEERINNILQGKRFQNLDDVVNTWDRTDTSFLNSLGSDFQMVVRDMEFWWKTDYTDPFKFTMTSALATCVGDGTDIALATNVTASATTEAITVSAASPEHGTIPLTDLISSSDPMWRWIRPWMFIREENAAKNEQILILKDGSGNYWGVRGVQAGGQIVLDTTGKTKVAKGLTEDHAANAVWVPVGQTMSELSSHRGEMVRQFGTSRYGLMGMYDFTLSQSQLEPVFNAMQRSADESLNLARKAQLDRMNEIWNHKAMFSVPSIFRQNGQSYFRPGGLLHYIKRYCSERWSGADVLADGFFGQGVDTTVATNMTQFKCNGDSNFRIGVEGNPTQPAVFNQTLFDELDARMMENAGRVNFGRVPNTCYLPNDLYTVATQWDKDRVRTPDFRNAVSGYFSRTYITPYGNEYKFIRDPNLKNMFVLGNPANGSRKYLLQLAKFNISTNNLTNAWRYVSIMGFKWDYPEYLWAVHQNVRRPS